MIPTVLEWLILGALAVHLLVHIFGTDPALRRLENVTHRYAHAHPTGHAHRMVFPERVGETPEHPTDAYLRSIGVTFDNNDHEQDGA